MKYFMYKAVRDNEKQGPSPYWQVWVYDRRAEGGMRLVESDYHTKWRAHTLADLFNAEIRQFIAYNNEDLTLPKPEPVPEVVIEKRPEIEEAEAPPPEVEQPSIWQKAFRSIKALFAGKR